LIAVSPAASWLFTPAPDDPPRSACGRRESEGEEGGNGDVNGGTSRQEVSLEFVENLLPTNLTSTDMLAWVLLDRSVSPDGFRCLD
jgi:hypothetical protein